MAGFAKNAMEIAISSLVVFISSILFSMLGAFIGGIVAYIIMKRANPDETLSMHEGMYMFLIMAIAVTALFIITTSFFINAIDMPIYQILGVKNFVTGLVASGQQDTVPSLILIINIVIGLMNMPAFLLGVYTGFKFLKGEGKELTG